MIVILLKDWAGNKKGAQLEINDESVISKGKEIGLFESKQEKPKK